MQAYIMPGAGLTPEQRLDLIHEKMLLCRIVPTGDRPFNSTMAAYALNEFRLNALRFTPHRTYARKAGSDAMLISLQQSGSVVARQNGREARVAPNDCFFVDTAEPFNIDCDAMRCISLIIPGALVRAVVPGAGRYTATAISGRRGPGAVLRHALETLHESMASGSDSAATLAQAIPYLLGSALADRNGVPAPNGHDDTVARIRELARIHLRDPELDSASIASAAGLSVRRVHQLFSREPETLMHWVWAERLRGARADLRDPQHRERSIGDIAFSWGFSELPHFSRSFKAAFGVTPRAYR